MPRQPSNIGASVRTRLLRLSQEKNQIFELVLTRYVIERLLYRLAVSPHANGFVLKGAMLLMTWFEEPFRGTRDLDLLGYGDPTPQAALGVLQDVMSIEAQDGVRFDADGVRVERIREDNNYRGLRFRTTAEIGGARVAVKIDVGFGDATEPGVELLDYPVLLDMPVPRLRAYARETVIAEKFQAIVALGRANSRMKDYYDLWVLKQSFAFDEQRLASAICATFGRRDTSVPEETPDGLTEAFAEDVQKQRQWAALKRELAHDPGSLAEVVRELVEFLMPAASAARRMSLSQKTPSPDG